ncbi:hypothetical protein [Propionivibrio soli]|uniref:type III secretion apparatus assembly protein SctX n=1 Tax=Propionivibrio soli TaxID=2976531 RepID=UPI0021E81D64|nr:hypothetical protein [Propionivibrio soli]
MSDVRIGSGNFFSQGIDSISHVAASQIGGLPEQQELTPAEQTQRPLLDTLLALPNMESFLADSIRPELDSGELLLPANFQRAHDSTLRALQDAADKVRESDPDALKLFNRAARLLGDEKALRDLLNDYRTALHKG